MASRAEGRLCSTRDPGNPPPPGGVYPHHSPTYSASTKRQQVRGRQTSCGNDSHDNGCHSNSCHGISCHDNAFMVLYSHIEKPEANLTHILRSKEEYVFRLSNGSQILQASNPRFLVNNFWCCTPNVLQIETSIHQSAPRTSNSVGSVNFTRVRQ